MIDYIYSNNKPIHDLSGSLSDYNKNTTLSFEKIREQAWQENIMSFLRKQGVVAWLKKNAVCHSCESRNPEKNLR